MNSVLGGPDASPTQHWISMLATHPAFYEATQLALGISKSEILRQRMRRHSHPEVPLASLEPRAILHSSLGTSGGVKR